MPTPSADVIRTSNVHTFDHSSHWSQHATCPIEEERTRRWRNFPSNSNNAEDTARGIVAEQQPTPPAEAEAPEHPSQADIHKACEEPVDIEEEYAVGDSMSPLSVEAGSKDIEQRLSPSIDTSSAIPSVSTSSMNYEFSNVRLLPSSTSSYLRAGSRFRGTQQSDRQVYDVQVELKHVDMNESFLCGYLRIQGLTEDHPTLITYFEGEIIGTKYTFQTKHAEWGSNEKVDFQHWARFPAWRPLAKQAKKPDFSYKNYAGRENIFMRWKEYFLVPDHRVRAISGASFEGFYYICFNQVAGTVSGIYFHAKSEKFVDSTSPSIVNKANYVPKDTSNWSLPTWKIEGV
ncbi:MAG: hypothetical protein M1836_003111 [Candelina mexicana]|nr:MAG: hypothetical protein M1836_003111 [Candelina mexicana]